MTSIGSAGAADHSASEPSYRRASALPSRTAASQPTALSRPELQNRICGPASGTPAACHRRRIWAGLRNRRPPSTTIQSIGRLTAPGMVPGRVSAGERLMPRKWSFGRMSTSGTPAAAAASTAARSTTMSPRGAARNGTARGSTAPTSMSFSQSAVQAPMPPSRIETPPWPSQRKIA